jgi:hypothetical protein
MLTICTPGKSMAWQPLRRQGHGLFAAKIWFKSHTDPTAGGQGLLIKSTVMEVAILLSTDQPS